MKHIKALIKLLLPSIFACPYAKLRSKIIHNLLRIEIGSNSVAKLIQS